MPYRVLQKMGRAHFPKCKLAQTITILYLRGVNNIRKREKLPGGNPSIRNVQSRKEKGVSEYFHNDKCGNSEYVAPAANLLIGRNSSKKGG